MRRDIDRTRHFVGDLYQRVISPTGDTLEERFRVQAGGRLIGEIVRADGAERTLYAHTDHQGTLDTLTAGPGEIYVQPYSPWGSPVGSAGLDETRAGYTGHQHDTDLDLIDMRGRIYDPLAARFMSPDPVMQAPFWSQGLNRYSYVFNNPVNNTDPTGFVTGNDAAAMYAPFHVPAMTTMGALGSGLGFATGPLSVGTTLLGGGAGFAQAGGTMNVAARQAAVGGGTGQGGTHATAQNTPVVADGDGAGSLAPHRRTAGPPDASGRPTMMTRLGPQTIPRFRSADAAAYWAAHIMNPASIAADREMLTAIIRIGKSLYTFTPPVWGGKNTVPGAHLIYADLIAEGADVVAMLHTHSRAGATSEYFSANDFGFANYTGVPLYLASPNGILSELEPMLATPTYLPNGHVPVFEPTRIIGRLPNDVWSPLPLPH